MIKDVFCTRCEIIQRDAWVESCDWVAGELDCPACGTNTAHQALCNGGAKLKTYLTCFEGRDWSGDIQHLGIEATYADGTPVHERAGSGPRTDTKYRAAFDERVGEKRARKRHALNKKRGKTPLHFT